MVVSLEIHKALREKNCPAIIKQVGNKYDSMITIIIDMLKDYPTLSEKIIKNGKVKQGILIMKNNQEIVSLGLVNEKIIFSENYNLRIIPVLHGG